MVLFKLLKYTRFFSYSTCFAMSFVVEDPKSKLNGCARRRKRSAQRKTQVGAYKKKLEMAGKKPSYTVLFCKIHA